ncbi:hypothetical protein WDU94_011955 [Cyamophila willieti]
MKAKFKFFNDNKTLAQEVLAKSFRNLRNNLEMMKFAEVLVLHPTKKNIVKKLIGEGRLEIVTGGWVMTDEATSHVFAMVDQLIEAFRAKFTNNNNENAPKHKTSFNVECVEDKMCWIRNAMGSTKKGGRNEKWVEGRGREKRESGRRKRWEVEREKREMGRWKSKRETRKWKEKEVGSGEGETRNGKMEE